MDVSTAYGTLGVGPQASWAELRRAYAQRLRAAHPDTGNGDLRELGAVRDAWAEVSRVHRPPVPVASPESGRLVDLYA